MSVQLCARRGAHRVVATALLFAACAAASVGLAQSGGAPGDWPTYSRDLAGTRYSPLTEITRAQRRWARAGVVRARRALGRRRR